MRHAILSWALLALPIPVLATEPAPASQNIRQAVARALPLIRKGSDGHLEQRTCFACHHQAIPILALTTAHSRGFPVEEEELQKHLRFINAFLAKNREEYQKGRGQGGQVDTAGYALWTLELGGWRPDATTAAVTEYLLLFDRDRDHWRATSRRPPSEASAFTTGYFAIRALQAFGTENQQDRISRRLEQLRQWLKEAAAQDTEDRVFQLLALKQIGCDAKQIQAAAQELLQAQLADGGWGQTEAMASDAYATATALFALHQAADLPTRAPAYQRGIRYLLQAQQPDGSWHVRSRSRPFQTYFESGFPHGKDQFISLAASAWATTTLLLALPAQAKRAGESSTAAQATGRHKTEVAILGDVFLINGQPTYAGRTWRGHRIEGLLLNARLVQGIFDDLNPQTRSRWAYPDTGHWDSERNTREFLAAMPAWRKRGLLAFTINLQGGCPVGYAKGKQPWHNSALREDGSLRPDYMNRLDRILRQADELGMVVILGVYYFGQDERLRDEAAIVRGLDNAIDWLLDRDYRHVLLEINNECNVRYSHAILKPERVHELIERARGRTRNGRRLLVSTSYGGGTIPRENVVCHADFLLLHGNGVSSPDRIADMVRQTRQVVGYRPIPILFNEDDHFDFDRPRNNLVAALSEYCSWGYFDPGQNDYRDGFQSPPVKWSITTPRKRAFFDKVQEITGQ